MIHDSLNTRMKLDESLQSRTLAPGAISYVRLDGQNFSKWTRGLDKPFDADLAETMDATTLALVDQSNAILGYTQSDEITLVFHADPPSQVFFAGKVEKMISHLAVIASESFNLVWWHGHGMEYTPARFDARLRIVPDFDEATNVILWRERDATRNAVLGLGQHHIGRRAILGMKTGEIIDRLRDEVGVPWEAVAMRQRHGAFFQRVKVLREMSRDELDAIPEKYRPTGPVERSEVRRLDVPVLLDEMSHEQRRRLLFGR